MSEPPPITDDERVRRIGELICKGILVSPGLRSDREVRPAPDAPGAVDLGSRIVEYLRRHSTASPGEMRVVFNLSRSRTYRALQRLLETRVIVRNGGRTTAAGYRLADIDPSRN